MGNEFVSTIQGFIIKDLHESMKNGDDVRRDFLRVILSEFNKIDKILDDSQATEVLVKMRNDNKIILEALEQQERAGSELFQTSLIERDILRSYLPIELSEVDMKTKMSSLVEVLGVEKNIKSMQTLKQAFMNIYPGQNPKLVSKVAMSILCGH